jgi:hypothetical protein
VGYGLVIYKGCFHETLLGFQSYSKHKDYFDVNFKQTCSKKIQVIPMGRFESLCFAVLVKA